MISRLEITITVSIGILLWLGLCVWGNVSPLDFKESLKLITSSGVIVYFGRLIYFKWFWKYPPFNYAHKMPVLEGVWTGKLISDYKQEETGTLIEKDIKVIISQPDISNVFVKQVSDESFSKSYADSVVVDEHNDILLTYSYLNEPNADVRHRSEISFGSVRLSMDSKNSVELKGNYWTDRKTRGRMILVKTKG